MKLLSKRIFLALVITACIIGVIAAALYATIRISPSTFRHIVEKQIEDITGQKILVEDAVFEIFWHPKLILLNVRAGKPEEVYLEIQRIETDFSLRHILLGRVELTGITFGHPSVYINTDMLAGFEGRSESTAFPGVNIKDGYLRLSHAGQDLIVRNINGLYKPDRIDLSAIVSGGSSEVHALYRDGWKGKITSGNIDLSELGSHFKGICNVDSSFDLTGAKIDASLNISVDSLGLPWTHDGIEWGKARITIQGDRERLDLNDISIITPVASLSGQAILTGMNSASDAVLNLNMESSQFDYEQVAGLLPSFSDLPWLDSLLREQIRNGKSRFSEISYNGPVKGLADTQSFFNDAYIVQDLIGQSFGAGHGPERITDITGKVIYGEGGIACKGLSGLMNASDIQNVNLFFRDIAMPVSTTTAEVKADMPAQDFIDTWRSAMVPESTHALLSPVSNIEKGRVRGKVDITWNDAPDSPVHARGDISLENCTYSWGKNMIEGHSGTITAEDFGSPVKIAFTGKLNGRSVQRFDASVDDPFGEKRTRFFVQTEHPLELAAVSLTKESRIIIDGTGTNGKIDAAAKMQAVELKVFDTVYRPAHGILSAEGRLRGTLWPGLDLHLDDMKPKLSSGSLSISADIKDDTYRAQIKGALDLKQFRAVINNTEHNLTGAISGDVSVEQGETLLLSGVLKCENALVYSSGKQLVIDGTVDMQNHTMKCSELNLTSGGKKIRVTSGSLDMENRPYFTGGLVIEGVHLDVEDDDTADILNLLDMDAYVELVNPDLYGVALNSFKANARLKNRELVLSDMVIKGISGTAHGTASTDPAGKTTFDIVVSLKNAGIRQFFYAVAKEDSWVHGDMDLEGHLWGSTDSINGTLAFMARNGNIKKYALFSRIFALLNIYRIIESQDLELTSKNFPYNVISSTFTIRDSTMFFDDFYLDSNALQLSAVGLYSMKTRKIDAHIGIQPFESVDRTISMIPLLGWVLTGEDKKLIVVSMKVRGELDDPIVQVAPLDTISKPVKESLFRFLQIPSDIIRRSQEILPKNKD
ncbi:MAG: AsmA-like C-terminal domain-containing protein [Deltaproteobacteria bacterium]|nr:AsmA-like C-terminal domain-containing protein [Deltaproteobacteria bacterium]